MPVRPPIQPSLESERLRRAQDSSREELERRIVDRIPHGGILWFVDDAVVPDGWHLCDGSTLLRDNYPKLALALRNSTVVNNSLIELPNITMPPGLAAYIWGPD